MKGRYPLDQQTINMLEFPEIKTRLAALALSGLGRRLAEELTPRDSYSAVSDLLTETSEARQLLDAFGSPPLSGLADLSGPIQKAKSGGILDPLSLQEIGDFLRGCRKTCIYMKQHAEFAPHLTGYAWGISGFEELESEINRCIANGAVTDAASPALRKIRSELSRLRAKIKEKLEQILLSPSSREFLQETVISIKEGRQVLLVKASCKASLPGVVIGSSGSGSTLFVEPIAVHRLSNELRTQEGAEEEAIYQILAGLSGAIGEAAAGLERNLEIMGEYDFAFAKARLSRMMRGTAPRLNETGTIRLRGARHPLLGGDPVPLNLTIGPDPDPIWDYRTLVITGPNTGGKTVTLKTAGLLTLMAQAGLHIPAEAGSELPVFGGVLADIGDGQSITDSLSTFSAHIGAIIRIMKQCGPHSLVLIDEVGTGTDPSEGAALAVAILEYIHNRGAITLASTHYPELKSFALTTPGFKNGCMAFDRQELKPLYQLIIGRPGESNALWIAAKLGMPDAVLNRARREMTGSPGWQPEDEPLLTKALIGPQPSPTAEWAPPCEEKSRETPLGEGLPIKELPFKAELPRTASVKSKATGATETVRPLGIGDRVTIPFLNEQGVVAGNPDSKGRIRVLVKGKKMELPVKRVKRSIPAEELYPDDYDLNIVLLSKEERKMKHRMERGLLHGVERIIPPEEQ